ncbi:hypothetical protein [Catellatospora sp. TT07R-123]|uniref:hypothetical protein n=1 Tax=Catellatospora sp. TT07R-123 TaxID=2733863 RepID=UPI001BB334FB|nr:hypothetical protein [Catellatospora sp. TT07R-123]
MVTTVEGTFAVAVREALDRHGLDLAEGDGAQLRELAAGGRLVVVLQSRPGRRRFDQVDQLAFRHGWTWLPVVNDHRDIRVGPLVVPRAGPCLLCYESRRRQHERAAPLDAMIESAWDDGEMAGPELFLPHHVTFAAAQIAAFASTAARGEYTFLRKDLREPDRFGRGLVEAVHGCGRCHD